MGKGRKKLYFVGVLEGWKRIQINWSKVYFDEGGFKTDMKQEHMTSKKLNESRLESPDQEALSELLDNLHLLWNHVPNEIDCKPQYYAKRKRQGVKPGVPDNFIYDIPPRYPNSKGAVIELKRMKGGTVSKEQTEWITELDHRGWMTAVCNGIDEAMEQVKKWGYMK